MSQKFNYTTIRAKGIGTNIQAGDFVKISGLTDSLVSTDAESYADKSYIENLNGKTFKVYYVSRNELVIKCELESSVPYTGTVTVERISPDFDEGKSWKCKTACGAALRKTTKYIVVNKVMSATGRHTVTESVQTAGL